MVGWLTGMAGGRGGGGKGEEINEKVEDRRSNGEEIRLEIGERRREGMMVMAQICWYCCIYIYTVNKEGERG